MSEDIDEKSKRIDDTFSITMELQRPLFVDEEITDTNNKENNEKFKIKKVLIIGIIISLIIATALGGIWLSKSYKATDIAKAALISDENVEVKNDEYISFTPKKIDATKGLILYPGTRVESEAYAVLAKEIASNGYEVAIVNVPFNIALFGENTAKKVIEDHSEISKWVVGGQSLGGEVASKFATKNNMVDGVVFLASYPNNDDLKNMGKEVLSIWGSKDGIINFKNLIQSKENLPDDTTYVEIEGANYSQFGDYGKQKGDNEALISSKRQMEITYKNIVKFLEKIK